MEKKKIEIIVFDQNITVSFIKGLKTNKYLSKPKEENVPDPSSKRMSKCRAYYELKDFDIIIRCLEDIMPPEAENIPQTYLRNSEEQYKLLCGYIKNDSPDLVIAVNSAGSTLKSEGKNKTLNGCVYMGCEYFTYDARKYDKNSVSDLKPYVYSVSSIDSKIFNIFSEEEKKQIASKFKVPINFPANPLTLNLSKDYVTRTSVNLTSDDITDDVEKDLVNMAKNMAENIFGDEKLIVSTNTMQGVVNMAAIKVSQDIQKNIVTLFVSAIEHRDGYYDVDFDSNGEQERIVSYNAGVTAAALVERIGILF